MTMSGTLAWALDASTVALASVVVLAGPLAAQAVPEVQSLSAADTARVVATALTAEMGKTVDGPFWFSLESRRGRSEGEWTTLSPAVGEALRQLYPSVRVVQQGMDQVRCGPEEVDREPGGCAIENGWPIVFVSGFRVLRDGQVRLSLQAKVQYSNRSASSGFTALLGKGDDGWRVVVITNQWAT